MKTVKVLLLIVFSPGILTAQNKNNLYADIACNNLGFSVTYDRRLIKHFDIGAGMHFNDYKVQYNNRQFAVYADLRPWWAFKKNLIFSFVDIGLAMGGGREPASVTITRNGLYAGFGFGYCYKINRRGIGPYVSLGLDGHVEHRYDPNPALPPRSRDYSMFDAEGVMSLGFKF